MLHVLQVTLTVFSPYPHIILEFSANDVAQRRLPAASSTADAWDVVILSLVCDKIRGNNTVFSKKLFFIELIDKNIE